MDEIKIKQALVDAKFDARRELNHKAHRLEIVADSVADIAENVSQSAREIQRNGEPKRILNELGELQGRAVEFDRLIAEVCLLMKTRDQVARLIARITED